MIKEHTLSNIEAIKGDIHRKILNLVNLKTMDGMTSEQLRSELKVLSERLIDENQTALNENERNFIVLSIQNEMLGLGPIEQLLSDPSVSDILVNGPNKVYVERHGQIEHTDVHFDSDAHLLRIIDKIVSRIGRRVDELSPMVDARLPDGSRVNAIIPPLALDGPDRKSVV